MNMFNEVSNSFDDISNTLDYCAFLYHMGLWETEEIITGDISLVNYLVTDRDVYG